MADAAGVRDPRALRAVLWAKVALTVVWAALLWGMPADAFGAFGREPPRPMVFIRLLGAAFVALMIGYLRGIRALDAGRPPVDAVVVGIVSNGLASLLVMGYGVSGAYDAWAAAARAFMWGSGAATLAITLGLIAFRPR